LFSKPWRELWKWGQFDTEKPFFDRGVVKSAGDCWKKESGGYEFVLAFKA
jgi:hypothetical protein